MFETWASAFISPLTCPTPATTPGNTSVSGFGAYAPSQRRYARRGTRRLISCQRRTLLFEICWELIRNGKPGRPKKTLKKGVKVRIKNKGSQAHKRGPKRPKYQAPWKEHPDTEPGFQ